MVCIILVVLLLLSLLCVNVPGNLAFVGIVLKLCTLKIRFLLLLKLSISMIDDLTRITRYRAQVAGMLHDLMIFSSERPGMKLKDIAACIGISTVTCSRAHTGTVSLSYLPFTKLQELYFKEFGHEYGK